MPPKGSDMSPRQSSLSVHQTEEEREEELQISEFIKDPATLKLLILAGTNIRPGELSTVSKCRNLIKLDLSANMLSSLPMSFHQFSLLKIIYLHDNNLFDCTIEKTTAEYISLFNNPLKQYRRQLLASDNPKLFGIDLNIVTKKERLFYEDQQNQEDFSLAKHTEIKWPIVETSSTLESEEDYLNLLKAEIFVVNNLSRKSLSVQAIESYLRGHKQQRQYKGLINSMSDEMKLKKASVLDAARQWERYTQQRKKLRAFLQSKNQEHLLRNRLQNNRAQLSQNAKKVMDRFLLSVRAFMCAKRIIRPHLTSFREYTHVAHSVQERIEQSSRASDGKHFRIYFLKSENLFLEKIFMYCKRLLFSEKNYDLCDNFDKLVVKQKKEHYAVRIAKNNLQEKSFVLDSARRSMSLVLSEKNVDRKHFLYTRKGHKHIAIKNRIPRQDLQGLQKDMSKALQTEEKISRVYRQYDCVVSYCIDDSDLFEKILKIIRYFNSGNSNSILSNQAAYFQTEINFQSETQKPKKEKMFVGLEFFMKRALAANVIQKCWRRFRARRESDVGVVEQLREKRAGRLISHWLRNLRFGHRLLASKTVSYIKTVQKSAEMYLQLDIYINLPRPTNLLQVSDFPADDFSESQALYQLLHENSCVEIVDINGRKWVRFVFQSVSRAFEVQKQLLYNTYRFYYNGFYLRLFSYFETQDSAMLAEYQMKVRKLFKIQIKILALQGKQQSMNKKLAIENMSPFFVWVDIGDKHVHQKFEYEKKSIPINVFIYNKHQRPLKINCDLNWFSPLSIYHNKKELLRKFETFHGPNNSIRSRTPSRRLSLGERSRSKETAGSKDVKEYYLGKASLQKRRSHSRRDQIFPHNTSLLRNFKNAKKMPGRIGMNSSAGNFEMGLLSQTMNVRKK